MSDQPVEGTRISGGAGEEELVSDRVYRGNDVTEEVKRINLRGHRGHRVERFGLGVLTAKSAKNAKAEN